MNKRCILLSLTLLLMVAGCRHQESMSEAARAAYECYHAYADHKGLTVAMVGDYKPDTNSYSAVMLQAQDSLAWARLMEDLGLVEHESMVQDLLQYMNMDEGLQHHISQSTDDVMQYLNDHSNAGNSTNNDASSANAVEYEAVTVLDVKHWTVWQFFYCDTMQMHAIVDHFFTSNKSIMVDLYDDGNSNSLK